MAEDRKKYNFMENVLNEINRKFVSLSDDDVKRNNQILQSIVNQIVTKIKEIDPLFKAMYTRVFYGGSYYDGLRVGKPSEFDLDLLLALPRYAEPVLTTGSIPGFVHLQLEKYEAWMKQPEASPAYRTFIDLLDEEHFLDTQKVLSWMQGLVQKTLNDFPSGADRKKKMLTTPKGNFEVIVHTEGPALTLKISGIGVQMDVDLVTCFVFSSEKWPEGEFRPNPVSAKPEFFIVPKKPKLSGEQPTERYWRLSFQEQERVLIDGKRTLKPTIKLLKKLRDVSKHECIASYYIKTVLLHITETKNDEFWKNSLSYVFMTILKDYREFIENENIPYYWNTRNNLIGGVDSRTLQDINNKLKKIINDIEDNGKLIPLTVARYLLTRDEFFKMTGATESNYNDNNKEGTTHLKEYQDVRLTVEKLEKRVVSLEKENECLRKRHEEIEKNFSSQDNRLKCDSSKTPNVLEALKLEIATNLKPQRTESTSASISVCNVRNDTESKTISKKSSSSSSSTVTTRKTRKSSKHIEL